MVEYRSLSMEKLAFLIFMLIVTIIVSFLIKLIYPFYIFAFFSLYYVPFIITGFYNYKQRMKVLENYDLICPECLNGNFKGYEFCATCGKNLKETIKFYIEPDSDIEITENQLIEYKKNILGKRNGKINKYNIVEMRDIKINTSYPPFPNSLMFGYGKKRELLGGHTIDIDSSDENEILKTLKTLKAKNTPPNTIENGKGLTNKEISERLEKKRKERISN